jgi:hypothetical protein
MSININKSNLTDNFSTLQLSDKNLNKEDADCLFKLYQRFSDHAKEQFGITKCDWMAEDFTSVKDCSFEWQNLDIALPLDKVEEILNRTEVLQLRSIPEDSKVLIIGCGNSPFADDGSYPLRQDEWEEYRLRHKHPKAITINPHLAHNPTLVGFFGAQQFPMLKSGQFDLIVIEVARILDTPIGRKELGRLASAQGKVIQTLGDKCGYAFSWEDNTKNAREPDYVLPEILIKDLNIYESFNYKDLRNSAN